MLVKIHNFQKIQTSHLSLNHIPDFLNSWALLSISLSWPPLSSSSLISILTGSGSSLQLGSLRLRLIVDNRENIISNLWMFQKCTWQQLHHLPCKPQSLSFHHCPLNIHFEFQTQYSISYVYFFGNSNSNNCTDNKEAPHFARLTRQLTPKS